MFDRQAVCEVISSDCCSAKKLDKEIKEAKHGPQQVLGDQRLVVFLPYKTDKQEILLTENTSRMNVQSQEWFSTNAPFRAYWKEDQGVFFTFDRFFKVELAIR